MERGHQSVVLVATSAGGASTPAAIPLTDDVRSTRSGPQLICPFVTPINLPTGFTRRRPRCARERSPTVPRGVAHRAPNVLLNEEDRYLTCAFSAGSWNEFTQTEQPSAASRRHARAGARSI